MSKNFLYFISLTVITGACILVLWQNKQQRSDLAHCSELRSAVERLVSPQYVTDQNLAQAMQTMNIKYPAIAHAQALEESANFTSPVFGRNHNLFGMKHPTRRVTTSLGEVQGYAYYATWIDSVLDYALWFQTYADDCSTEEEVYTLLDQIYAEQGGYSGRIRVKASSLQKQYYD